MRADPGGVHDEVASREPVPPQDILHVVLRARAEARVRRLGDDGDLVQADPEAAGERGP